MLGSGLASASSELEPYLQLILQVADSSITYRSRYPTVLQTELVLEVLLSDESNPRSVAFQLVTLLHQVTRLQELHDRSYDGVERALAVRALATVRDIHVADIAHRDASGRFVALDELIGELRVTLYEISEALTSSYLSHLTASQMTASW